MNNLKEYIGEAMNPSKAMKIKNQRPEVGDMVFIYSPAWGFTLASLFFDDDNYENPQWTLGNGDIVDVDPDDQWIDAKIMDQAFKKLGFKF